MPRPYSLSSRQQVRMSVPNNSPQPQIPKSQQHIIKFPYCSYPFPNSPVTANLFHTILQCNLNKQSIEKIINLKCENVIGLKKIVKIRKKDRTQVCINSSDREKSPASTYSFYYQKVQYSLGHFLQIKSKQDPLLNGNKFNLDRAQLKKTLATVIAHMYKQGIIIFLEFSHIGVNDKGIIKIYIAPNVLFDTHDYNPKTKVLILTYLNNVLKEIDAKFPKTLRTKHSIESFKFKNQLSIEKDIDSEKSYVIEQENNNSMTVQKNQKCDDFKRKDLIDQQEKSINQDQQNFIGISRSTNLGNLKLQSQIKTKLGNHKLASKVSQNIQSQKKSKILRKLQQKQKIDELTYQLEQMRKKIHLKIEQKRQKNMYLSKGLNNVTTQDRTHSPLENRYNNVFATSETSPFFLPINQSPLQKKRKSSKSSINFYQGVITQQKNINCINIYNPKHFPQKSYYQMTGDDGMSVDTYEMEIGDHYEMPSLKVPSGMRNSISHQKSKESVSKTESVKFNQNGEKSRFSESAGGKSFGNIVNLLKPQFIPKKSNIFQEPENQNQEDSKHSVSLKKSLSKEPSDRLSIQKRLQNISKPKNLPSQMIEAEENQIKGLKTVQQFKRDLKQIMKIGTITPQKPSTPKNKKFQTRLTLPISKSTLCNPEIPSMYLRQTQYRPKTNHKLSTILMKKSALEEKVKMAMQRTKKAINVLQTAKIRQSGSLNTLKDALPLQ